jgi:anti-sigma regulatory factor (Ser/Thr protein kinase)
MSGQTTSGLGCATALVPVLKIQHHTLALRCTLVPDPTAARTARHALRGHFSGTSSAEVLSDLELVVTELVANAVSASAPSGRIQLTATPTGPALLVEVFDHATTIPSRRRPGAWGEGGRGLLLVSELSLSWGWYSSSGGKVVWALMPMTAPAPPSAPTPQKTPSA